MTTSRGYYSIASRRWIPWTEVADAELPATQATLRDKALRVQAKVDEIEARADAAAAAGDYDLARHLLGERQGAAS